MSKHILRDLDLETFLELTDCTEEVTKTGMWVLDLASDDVVWSKGTYAIHELSEDTDITLELAASFYSVDSLPTLIRKLDYAKETGKTVDGKFQITTAKGKIVKTYNTIKPILENGKVVRLYGTISDITEHEAQFEQLEQERFILNSIGDSVIGVDLEGKVIHWNKRAEELFEVSYDEIIGKSINKLGYAFDIDSLNETFAGNKREKFSAEWDYVNGKGKHVYLSITMSALRAHNGDLIGYIGVSKDITEQKEREKRINQLNAKILAEERKFQALIDQGEDVACILSKTGKIEYISKNVSRVLGLEVNNLLGEDISELCLVHANTLKDVFEKVQQGEERTIKIEHPAVKTTGEEIWLESIFTNALDDKAIQGVQYNFRNITTRKEAEIKHEKARLLAEEMTAMKTNFLATMSHELRTPLNGIMGTAELIELESLESSVKELVKIQRESGERLMNTLNSILAMTKLEAENTEYNLEEVNVSGVLEQTAALYSSKAALKGIDLVLDCASKTFIKANETMLSQCINNLVDNALKFTDEGSIRMKCAPAKGFINVYIADTGIGISEELRERIFEPFWQVQMGQARKYQGTGLGLSIVKRYIEFIGGSICVESEPGKGSTFILSLPAIS